MLGRRRVEHNRDLLASGPSEVTAGLEWAPLGKRGEVRRLATNRDRRLLVADLQRRHRLDEATGVWVAWRADHRPVVAGLEHPACIHDDNLIARLRNDPKVVGDQDDGHPLLGLQLHEQRQDLLLGGDVQRGRRLVGEQQLRVAEIAIAIMTRWRIPPLSSCG